MRRPHPPLPDMETCFTWETLRCAGPSRARLKGAVTRLLRAGFPHMPQEEQALWCNDYFSLPFAGFQRQMLFLRDSSGHLIGMTLADIGRVRWRGRPADIIYIISQAVMPRFQRQGLGQRMGISLFHQWRPDLVIGTARRFSGLNHWVTLVEKAQIAGYQAFPQPDDRRSEGAPAGVIQLAREVLPQMLRNLSPRSPRGNSGEASMVLPSPNLVRKGIFPPRAGADPWPLNDPWQAFFRDQGLTERDGLLFLILSEERFGYVCRS